MLNLDKGILLEDNNVLLEWGQPIDKLAKYHKADIEEKGDRTIYEWGKHTILDGLEVELTNIVIGASFINAFKRFNSITSWTIGDKDSIDNFELISSHLIQSFGQPTETQDEPNGNEKFWIWRIGKVTISLNLFEQHVYKLCLNIELNGR